MSLKLDGFPSRLDEDKDLNLKPEQNQQARKEHTLQDKLKSVKQGDGKSQYSRVYVKVSDGKYMVTYEL